MNVRLLTKGLLLFTCAILPSGPLFAQAESGDAKVEKKKRDRRGTKKVEVPAEMQQYLDMMAPGEEHKVLAPLVGTWSATTQYWTARDAAPQESKASARRRLILGGRYVQEDFRGTFMGVPFQGMSITGYDKLKKAYVSTWVDNFGTGILFQTGKVKEDGKTIIYTGEALDPQTGKNMKYHNVIRFEGKDKQVMQMFHEGPDGNEWKVMEITYTRRAARAKEGKKKDRSREGRRNRKGKADSDSSDSDSSF